VETIGGAQSFAGQALEMSRGLGGEEHPAVATALVDLGLTHYGSSFPHAE